MMRITSRKQESWDGMGNDLPGQASYDGPYDNPTLNMKLFKAKEYLNRHKKAPKIRKLIIFQDQGDNFGKYPQAHCGDIEHGIHN